MLYVLEKWIAMRTVSGNPKYMEECRRGARFLKNILQQLGAVSRMVSICRRYLQNSYNKCWV
jgi:di- and tripeptidase